MFVFALIQAPDRLAADVIAELREGVSTGSLDRELVFPVEHRMLWFDADQSTAVVGWWSGLDPYGGGTPWDDSGGAVTLFTGHLWPRTVGWPDRRPWARQLRHHVTTLGERVSDHGLSGVFTAASIDQHGDGRLLTDSFGVGLLYRCVRGDLTVYASTASLSAHLAAAPDTEPERDPFGVGWLAYAGAYFDDVTGFEAVSVIPAGSHVEIRRGSRPIEHPPGEQPWDQRPDGELDLDTAIAQVSDALFAEVDAAVSTLGADLMVDLTGGKDSRLVLAALLACGRHESVTFRTAGGARTADHLVAEDLADAFGLTHLNAAFTPIVEPFDRWLAPSTTPMGEADAAAVHREFVFCSSGGANLWWNSPVGVPTACVTLSGLSGELLRTNYARTDRLVDLAQVSRFVFVGQQVGGAGLIRAEHRDRYEQATADLLRACGVGAATPQDVVDRFYMPGRFRRWQGALQEFSRGFRALPLLNPVMVDPAFAIGSAPRRAEVLHYETMRLVDRRLVEFPFAQQTWRPDLGLFTRQAGPPEVPAATPRATEAGSTVGVAPKETFARAQRDRQAAHLPAILHRYLVEQADNPVFEVLDHRATQQAVADYSSLSQNLRTQVMGALTAAIWMAGDELAVTIDP